MTMQQTPLLLWRLLDRGAWITPNEEIVSATNTGSHRLTYAEAATRARQLASALKEHGIGIGDRDGSFMWNHHRHFEMYQAVPSMGEVLHTLNIRLGPKDLEYIINHGNARVIVVDDDLLPLLEPLAPRLPSVELYIVSSESGEWDTTITGAIGYEDFIRRGADDFAWPELDENAPLGLCYTSGTTGNPKGAMYTHRSTYTPWRRR